METKFNCKLPEDLVEDISSYRKAIEKFKSGEMEPAQFESYRLSRGIHEQRQRGTFMCRVRIPVGRMLAAQMEKLGQLSRHYGDGVLHLTTRQDVQLHNLKLDETPTVMEELRTVGLTSKGGGGNTVRNITACVCSGICSEEVFDVRPYAAALTEFMIKDPRSYTLPQKYEIAFSGCSQDCSLAAINDLGFIARKKIVDGKEVVGFRVYVAGGMGTYSRVSDILEDFIPDTEFIYIAEAIKNLFDKYGSRENRTKAGLRFLMEKWGYDRFKKVYQEELAELKKKEKISFTLDNSVIHALKSVVSGKTEISSETSQWFNVNVSAQKQADYCLVKVRIPLGKILAELFIDLASIAKEFNHGVVLITQDQNLVFPWIRKVQLSRFYSALRIMGFTDFLGGEAADVVCCPGADTCRLEICLSCGLSLKIIEGLKKINGLEEHKEIKIRISGCPNSCGQHPIGGVGLYGTARRLGSHLAPYYYILLGGRTGEGKTCLGQNVGNASAKDVPDLLVKFFSIFQKEKMPEEDFYAYLDRRGKRVMEQLLEDFSSIPSYEENKEYYFDWGSSQEFSLAGREAGEGAAMPDIIEPAAAEQSGGLMDLKGIPCPLNYVKAKLVMETMDEGEFLELILDEGEPIRNVPSSLEKDGQEILKIEKIDGGLWRVIVRKKV